MATGDRRQRDWRMMDGIQEILKSLKLDRIHIQHFFNNLLEFSRHLPPELIQVKALKPLGRGRVMPHQRAELKILACSLFLQAVQKHYDSSPRPGLEDMIESIMKPINNYYHSSYPLWILFWVSFFFFLCSWMIEWSTKIRISTMELVDFWEFAKRFVTQDVHLQRDHFDGMDRQGKV